jgi:hypothetical protein
MVTAEVAKGGLPGTLNYILEPSAKNRGPYFQLGRGDDHDPQ